tara:strand:+ start:223 stop:354 length:132 start_codon:yes stop_codon:yes gene_type:complete
MKVIETIIVKSTAETSESTTEETTNFPFSFTDEGAEDIVSAFN